MKQHLQTRLALMAMAAIAASGAAQAAETNIWSTSFDNPLQPYYENTGPWVNVTYPPNLLLLGPTVAAVPPGSTLSAFGSSYLQGSGLDLATFLVSGVGLGSGPQPVTLHLQFDLAFEDGWDPASSNPATEGFAFSFDGTPLLWNAANGFGAGPGGPGTILSSGSNVLGPAGGGAALDDTVVHYDFVFSHNTGSLLLGFQLTGASFIPIGAAGPGWGLDNFSLSAITGDDSGGPGDGGTGDGGVTPGGVPEAPVWALMIAGFGAVGAAARRRRLAFF